MRKQICYVLIALCGLITLAAAAFGQRSRASVPASEVNGTYQKPFTGKFKGSSNEIKVLALGGGRLRIAMELIYPYVVNGELSANIGELDGEAIIKGDTAIYSSSEFGKCTITIKFVRPGAIKVSQDGVDADCGFGHNVTSYGTYHKVSSKRPKFEDKN